MNVLVNYDPAEAKYLKALDYFVRSAGHSAVVTNKTLTPYEMDLYATRANCSAVIIANVKTLKNYVDDEKPTLDAWRGSRINKGVPAIVVDSLSNIYAKPEGDFLFRRDLAKVSKTIVPPRKFKYSVLKRVDQFPKWLELCNQAVAIGLDIETNQHSRKKNTKSSTKVPCFDDETLDIAGLGETWITVLSISILLEDGKLETCVLPLVNGRHDFWELDSEYAAAIKFMQDVCATKAPKVFHNGLYDCFHLIRYNCYPENWCLDTMALSWCWYSELPKDLGFLSSWLLYDAEYWKWLSDKEHKVVGNIEDYWMYAAKDTWYMMRNLQELLLQGSHWMFTNYYFQFPLVYPSIYSAFEGMLVNNTTRLKLLDKARAEVDAELAKIRIMTDDAKFNPSSPQQNSSFLYDVLGAARPPRAKSVSATGKKERRFVSSQHPMIAMFTDALDNYAKNAKGISQYFKFIQWNGRLLWGLDPFGTETSRFASRKSHAWVGAQIQNQPPYAKEMYEPDPGYLLFEIDYSKAEAICTAYLSQCLALIIALVEPELDNEGEKKDFYKVLGELFFGMKYEDVTKEFRNKVLKKIQHGTNYMMGGATFLDNLEDFSVIFLAAEMLGYVITPEPKAPNEFTAVQFATKLLDSYHIPFPEVSAWWESIRNEVASTHMLVNPHGFVRYFFGDAGKNHAVWRSAVAHQPQSTSVGNLNKGYLKAYKFAASLKDKSILRIKTQIHDSLLGQVKIEYAMAIIPLLADLLVARQEIYGRQMVIPVEIEVTNTNWKDKKSWKDFSETILPTLGSQKSLTPSTVGLQ